MKVIFFIDKINNYRIFSEFIEEGLKRGINIECCHDYRYSKTGDRSYLFPHIEKSPFYNSNYDRLTFKKIMHDSDYNSLIRENNDIDYYVSYYPLFFKLEDNLLEKISGKWCIISNILDAYLMVWHWHYFGFIKSQLLLEYYRMFFPTTNSLYADGMNWMKKYPDPEGKDNYKFFDSKYTKVYPIGNSLYNKSLSDFEKENVRMKYGVPPGNNILIYLPFPFYPSRSNFCWQAAFSGIFVNKYKIEKRENVKVSLRTIIVSIVEKILYSVKIMCDREARMWLIRGWNEPSVIKSIRSFCDKNHLLLVVKPRRKFHFSEKVYKCADIVIDDDESQQYPSILQELLSISKLVMGYHTTAVIESVTANVLHVNIECPVSFFDDEARVELHSCREGSMYNFSGAVVNMTIQELLANFSEKKLVGLSSESVDRNAYKHKYIGPEHPRAGENFYDILESK